MALIKSMSMPFFHSEKHGFQDSTDRQCPLNQRCLAVTCSCYAASTVLRDPWLWRSPVLGSAQFLPGPPAQGGGPCSLEVLEPGFEFPCYKSIAQRRRSQG